MAELEGRYYQVVREDADPRSRITEHRLKVSMALISVSSLVLMYMVFAPSAYGTMDASGSNPVGLISVPTLNKGLTNLRPLPVAKRMGSSASSLQRAQGHAQPLPCLRQGRLGPCQAVSRPTHVWKLDLSDPDVEAEYKVVMEMTPEEIESELVNSGIPTPPGMMAFDLQSMLVEVRLRKAGKMGKKAPTAPPKGASKFEVALFEKPAFKDLYDEFLKRRLQNEANLCIEYINDPKLAKERYSGNDKYMETVARIENALTRKIEQKVSSGRVKFQGFPSGMGEAGLKMTLETFGEIASLSNSESSDGMTLEGLVEFKETESAKAFIDKWDGVDMGLGTKLVLEAK